MKTRITELIISDRTQILSALKKMDQIRRKLLIVLKDENFIGLLSIGDIQRAIIENIDLKKPVTDIMRQDYIVAKPGLSIGDIKRQMLEIRTEFMPIVNENKRLLDVLFWEEMFEIPSKDSSKNINVPIVIMAGGVGSRLKPLTNVLPKPLIPLGAKTMLEEIFDRFGNYGCNTFYVSINYKADLIRYYITEQQLPYKICFFREEKPLGTAGSLSLLKGRIDQTFFVTNCDILIDQDYSEVLSFHKEKGNEITIISVLKSIPIEYGTLETAENGKLINLYEKPELTFKINSGMYILESALLNEIPADQVFHLTDLIHKVLNRKGKIGVFPVTEKSWIDVGNWKDYIKDCI